MLNIALPSPLMKITITQLLVGMFDLSIYKIEALREAYQASASIKECMDADI